MYKTIIIGAGPAGIQMAYFLEKAGESYIVLEREAKAASFFSKYPHSAQLISINKKNVGNENPDFQLRHDWNSLLSDDLDMRFTKRTNDYYPNRNDLVSYLNDFANKFCKVQYNTNVLTIRKLQNEKYQIVGRDISNSIVKYECEKLIVATGMGKPRYPNIKIEVEKPILHYGDYPPNYFLEKENVEQFRDKSLLILGNGNSAFELGNLLNPLCSTIMIVGKDDRPWSISSHYAGDIRAVYLPFLDTFLLKSLNAVDKNENKTASIVQENGKYYVYEYCDNTHCSKLHKSYEESIDGFDHVIFCTGWMFDKSIFNFDVEGEKYPILTEQYESVNNKNLYFIGSLMHSFDYRKSSGGFIHGFRYLIEYFFHYHYDKKFITHTFSDLDTLIDHIIKRINTSSSLYQMYGQMCDVIVLQENKQFDYKESVPKKTFELNAGEWVFILMFEYGEKQNQIEALTASFSSLGFENKSHLLHPVLYAFQKGKLKDIIHFDEDILLNFRSERKYFDKFKRTFKMFL